MMMTMIMVMTVQLGAWLDRGWYHRTGFHNEGNPTTIEHQQDVAEH